MHGGKSPGAPRWPANGAYATALKEWRPLAKQGFALAQHSLGLMYYQGKSVPRASGGHGGPGVMARVKG